MPNDLKQFSQFICEHMHARTHQGFIYDDGGGDGSGGGGGDDSRYCLLCVLLHVFNAQCYVFMDLIKSNLYTHTWAEHEHTKR